MISAWYLLQVVYKNTVENSSHIITWRLKVAQTVVLKRKFSVKKDVAFGNYAVLNFRFLASAISQNFLRAFKLWQLESLTIISLNLIKFIDIQKKLIYCKFTLILKKSHQLIAKIDYYSKALRCTFLGERKNSCSSKFVQLLFKVFTS